MSNHTNHRRGEKHRTEHGPAWESHNPGKGCNSTHVARARKKWKRIKNRSIRHTGVQTRKFRTHVGKPIVLHEDEEMNDEVVIDGFGFTELCPECKNELVHDKQQSNRIECLKCGYDEVVLAEFYFNSDHQLVEGWEVDGLRIQDGIEEASEEEEGSPSDY